MLFILFTVCVLWRLTLVIVVVLDISSWVCVLLSSCLWVCFEVGLFALLILAEVAVFTKIAVVLFSLMFCLSLMLVFKCAV